MSEGHGISGVEMMKCTLPCPCSIVDLFCYDEIKRADITILSDSEYYLYVDLLEHRSGLVYPRTFLRILVPALLYNFP